MSGLTLIEHLMALDAGGPAQDDAKVEAALQWLASQDEGALKGLLALILAGYGMKCGKDRARALLLSMIAGLVLIPDDGDGVA